MIKFILNPTKKPIKTQANLRSNEWLEKHLKQIWQTYFSDIPKVNQVIIKFGRKGKRQLGAIKANGPRRRFRRPGKFPKDSWWLPESTSTIVINGHFRDPNIPEYIIDTTIAHELVHYSHGFASPHPQLFRYPHFGGIVTKELKNRGLTTELKLQKQWLKKHWRQTP